jgi:hypothetical protein
MMVVSRGSFSLLVARFSKNEALEHYHIGTLAH